jgi:hypothetical protein
MLRLIIFLTPLTGTFMFCRPSFEHSSNADRGPLKAATLADEAEAMLINS